MTAHAEFGGMSGAKRGSRYTLYTLLFLISACSIGLSDRIQEIEPGMSQVHVLEKLGQPDERQTVGETTGLKWSNQLVRVDPPDEVGYWVPAHYWVVLRNGRVISHGYGSVREVEAPRRLLLEPLRR